MTEPMCPSCGVDLQIDGVNWDETSTGSIRLNDRGEIVMIGRECGAVTGPFRCSHCGSELDDTNWAVE